MTEAEKKKRIKELEVERITFKARRKEDKLAALAKRPPYMTKMEHKRLLQRICKEHPELWQRRCLARLRRYGIISDACNYAHVSVGTFKKTMLENPEFKAAVKQARRQSCEYMEKELFRRGVEGVKEPVYQGGKLVGYKMVYSDACLIFDLKSRNPKKFREHYKTEIVGEGGKPISQTQIVNLSGFSVEELVRLKEVMEKAQSISVQPVAANYLPAPTNG